jgi:UDP-N-acetylglucosamine 2-epimerase
VETVELGWNHLVGANKDRITAATHTRENSSLKLGSDRNPYGDGNAAQRICTQLLYIL